MAYGDLAGDSGAVSEAGADVVREVGVDGREHGDPVRDGADHREEVDSRLEGAREEPGAGEWNASVQFQEGYR